jgi:hypothetical protein
MNALKMMALISDDQKGLTFFNVTGGLGAWDARGSFGHTNQLLMRHRVHMEGEMGSRGILFTSRFGTPSP